MKIVFFFFDKIFFGWDLFPIYLGFVYSLLVRAWCVFWCDSISRTLDLPDFQEFDSVMKINMGLQLRSITQIGFGEGFGDGDTCTYINLNKSLDCVFIKTRLISDMISFMFVLLDCSCRCRMAFYYWINFLFSEKKRVKSE